MKTERPEFILRKIKILFISAVLSTGIANSLPQAAQATSALRLPYPMEFGVKPSSTYDVNGKRMGGGNVLIEKTDDGGVRMTVINELDSVSRHTLVAELGPTENGESLQLLREEGKTTNQQGELIGSKTLDHRKGLLECLKGKNLKKSLIVPLPEDDRTVFELKFYQGLTEGEIAGLLNISARTVRRRWRLARQSLQAALGVEAPSSHGEG